LPEVSLFVLPKSFCLARTEETTTTDIGGILAAQQWPAWWAWELEFSAHLLKRMEDRAFNEVDLRRILEYATGHRPDILEGRLVIEAKHAGAPWEVIVEPDDVRKLLVVITAYPVE
jgi:hypothetical protein